MLMSAKTLLDSVRSRLQCRPLKRRQKSRYQDTEHLEQRALLSSISIDGGTLTYEADDGEMNRLRIRPLRNGAAYEITEQTRLWRNQVDDPFERPGEEDAILITVGDLEGLTANVEEGDSASRIVIEDPDRTITSIRVDAGDENDVVRVHTAAIGRGADRMYAPAYVTGGDGNDALITGWGDDVVDGGDGHDWIFTNSGDDELIGGDGGDRLEGGNDDDVLEGNDGSDTIYGGQGNDLLLGGDDHDRLDGRGGDDTLDGGDGNDHLSGGWHSDLVIGGAGSDLIMAQWGRHGRSDGDTVIGGLDDDRDGIQDDPTETEIDVINVDQGDDDLQGIDETFSSLRAATYVFNNGNMHHWKGFDDLRTREEWRAMSGAQKRDYWLGLRSHWNKDWSSERRAFYSTTARH